ncbi:hypothetical protein Poli38472_007824 [Pythium oligandrum]|uniref:HMG box domain-containing protein n=1 Tax=Pythium oligandrum TaxID=41045 RepID=A0A8K1CQW5_PYTOL|nr:hypothetical protein Poli38472_007824 [Pythium oligandrum]|eukprot:TMW68152.1 hypothetical protein Poli38472_007824 [Pythium oligandrum]
MLTRKLPRRSSLKVVEKACTTLAVPATVARELSVAAGGDTVRRQQAHLQDDAPSDDKPATTDAQRGGPKLLSELQLRVLAKTPYLVVLNKREDHRLDGAFDATIEKALHRDFPDVDKFRWIHQLDFATSGVMCVGLEKEATAMACRLFREKRVQKEYLAVVRGHLPFHPRELTSLPEGHRVRACTFSKLGLLIQDTEEFDRLKTQRKGTATHQKRPDYPRGVRQAPAFFQIERSALLREQQNNSRELTAEEAQLVAAKWKDLTSEQQNRYQTMSNEDKVRYMKELVRFLDEERERVAAQRRYDVSYAQERNEPTEEEEPVAYVFDDPIAEPGRDTFRMRIGDRTNVEDPTVAGKASATIAFVLGHGTYQDEPMTKVLLRPLTGRRHQLRLHLAHNGFPIVGDATYGSENETAPRMMLHAWRLWLMASPKEQEKYGDLYFASPDPFEDVVASQRDLTTMTFHKTKQQSESK